MIIQSSHSRTWAFAAMTAMVLIAAGCNPSPKSTPEDTMIPTSPEPGKHRFVVLDPGHFHAALVFKRAGYEGVSPLSAIYAPVGEDVVDHLARVVPFNNRAEDPAGWKYHVHLGPDFKDAMLEEKFGDILVISGRNNTKIDDILAAVRAGYNVLADKPLIIERSKFPVLRQVLEESAATGHVTIDIMTERYEITSILQRLIVAREPVFGTLTEGTPDDPAVVKKSVHHLWKYVAGQVLKRPWWFFDTSIQGEGLVDITTHLIDLTFWILHPETAIDREQDVEVVSAKHWPTVMTLDEYSSITRHPSFPPQFGLDDSGKYPYYCNGSLVMKLKGAYCHEEVIWNYKAPEGTGDTHYSIIKGTKAHVLVLQDKEQNFRPEVYVQPAPGADAASVGAALGEFIDSIQGDYPGMAVVEEQGRWRIDIPDSYRVGHEAHFGQVTDRFLEYLGGEPMPDWEMKNLLAKYDITTKALEMARE